MSSPKDHSFEELDQVLDEDSFSQLDRQRPIIATIIKRMVNIDISPSDIRAHICASYPNKWVDAQTIYQAARHCERHLKK